MTYYTRRMTGHSGVFTADRYKCAVDPDGRERRPGEEREQKLEDMRDELEFLKHLAPGRLLEVGCGLGFALWELARHGWRVHGVEPCDAAADKAYERTPKLRNYAGIARSVGAYSEGPMFDAVLSYHVIEHVANPEAHLTEIHDVMKPHAWLVLSTPDFDSPIAQLYGDRYRMLHDPTHISLFSRTGLHNMLTDFGFRVERVSTPFFGTRHHTAENIEKLKPSGCGGREWSPPGPGNVMTFYARRLP